MSHHNVCGTWCRVWIAADSHAISLTCILVKQNYALYAAAAAGCNAALKLMHRKAFQSINTISTLIGRGGAVYVLWLNQIACNPNRTNRNKQVLKAESLVVRLMVLKD